MTMRRLSVKERARLVRKLKRGVEKHSSLAREFGLTRQRIGSIGIEVGAPSRTEMLEKKRLEIAALLVRDPEHCLAQLAREQQVSGSLVQSARKMIGHEPISIKRLKKREEIKALLRDALKKSMTRSDVANEFPNSRKIISDVARGMGIHLSRSGPLIKHGRKEVPKTKRR